jgi:hypothetical protein
MAGVAIAHSPSGLVASSSNVRPALTILPSTKFTRNNPPEANGHLPVSGRPS